MKHLKTRLTILLCVLSIMLLCLGLAACGGKTYKVTLDYNAEQGEVTLSPEAENNEYEDGTELTVTVAPETGYEVETFTVSTDANAKLTDGKYKLTVSADTTIKVTFKTTEIAVSGITLTPDTLELEVGGRTEDATATLVATVEPADATDKTVTWTSSDPTVATVEGGNVTALAEGETTITATAGGKSATCVVTVTQHVHKAAEGAEWKQDTENNQHYKECVCGEHVEVGAHAAKDDTYYQDEENNKHYQLCVCGARVNESDHNLKINADKTKFECEQCDYEEAHTHDTQLQDAGESGHKTVCKTEGCGYESAVTAHSAKDDTYYKDEENNKHYQLCECGARVNEAAHSAAEGAEWKQDAANHYKECVCGEHVEVTAHSAKDDTYYQDEENNKHYQLCECGARVNESEHNLKINAEKTKFECEQCDYEEAHTHDTQLQDTGANGHKTVCKTEGCGYESAVTAHSEKDDTYYKDEENNKHYQLCECGARVNEAAHSAAEGAEWKQDAANHYKECVCGEHVEVTAHSAKDDTYYQDEENNKHYQLCECGARVNESEHTAKDSKWLFDDGDEETGKHYQLCVCGEKVNESAHQMSEEATSEGDNGHYFECEKCDFHTATVPHEAVEGSYQKGSGSFHTYDCKVCGALVKEYHSNVLLYMDYSSPNGEYSCCSKCDMRSLVKEHSFQYESDDAGHHSVTCKNTSCTYTSSAVECKSTIADDAWKDKEDHSGHSATCECGYVITEEHDELGEGGKCSKCGYLAGHICADNADANGYYDGLCDTCGQIVNNTWTFSAGTISAYNGNYTKLKIPTEIESVAVTQFDGNFANNATITDVFIPEGIVLTEIESGFTGLFCECSNLKTVVILTNITTLPMMTFDGCGQLDWIVLPASLSTISDLAFYFGGSAQTTLKDVYFMGTQQQWSTIEPDGFSVATSIAEIDVLKDAHIHFYKADGGSASANEWRWDVDGVTPKAWE